MASSECRHAFRVCILFDPVAPREYRTIERPRATIAKLVNAICTTAAPPSVFLQFYICEHRHGPDEFRSRLIRRDRFLEPSIVDREAETFGL